MEDSLHKVEVDSKLWIDIMEAFKSDWYRGITGYYALDVLGKWIKLGADYGFRILSPFGDAKNGFLAVIKDEKDFIEMLMECPQDDTSSFGEALKKSNVIDWDKNIIVLFPRSHIYECMKKIAPELNVEMEWVHYLHCYVLDKSSPLFDVSLPEDMKFDLLTEDIIPLVDSTWPHRYPGSEKYFQLLIKTKSGYGIYRNKQLVAFGFIKEMGALGHIYTLEEHRRKGYGEIVTKLICNVLLEEKRDVFSFCVEGNEQSCKMHEKIGFFKESTVYSFGIKRKISNMAIV